jgi:hypothetical protein
MASATADSSEGRNRKLGGILIGVVLVLVVLSILRVLIHS